MTGNLVSGQCWHVRIYSSMCCMNVRVDSYAFSVLFFANMNWWQVNSYEPSPYLWLFEFIIGHEMNRNIIWSYKQTKTNLSSAQARPPSKVHQPTSLYHDSVYPIHFSTLTKNHWIPSSGLNASNAICYFALLKPSRRIFHLIDRMAHREENETKLTKKNANRRVVSEGQDRTLCSQISILCPK